MTLPPLRSALWGSRPPLAFPTLSYAPSANRKAARGLPCGLLDPLPRSRREAQVAHLVIDGGHGHGGAFDVLGGGGLAQFGRLLAEGAGRLGQSVPVLGGDVVGLGEEARRLLQTARGLFELGPLIDVKRI